jgi:hypothetical protein
MGQKSRERGAHTEEALRWYFAQRGYFVVRGVPVLHDREFVTDVDIWLYARSGTCHRTRAIVDARDRGSPKALERILWAKGLQVALGLDAAIVATTDRRNMVREFGQGAGVSVLDGNSLGELLQKWAEAERDRLTQEDFFGLISYDGVDKLRGNWIERIALARARLLSKLDYSGCNAWLEDTIAFLDAFGAGERREAAIRCTYLCLSYFMVGLDFCLAGHAFDLPDRRREELFSGFTYGAGGKEKLDRVFTMIRQARPDVARELSVDLVQPDTGRVILAEFYSRTAVGNSLLEAARQFETLSYRRELVTPDRLEAPLKAHLGVIIDAHGLDRRRFLGDGSAQL